MITPKATDNKPPLPWETIGYRCVPSSPFEARWQIATERPRCRPIKGVTCVCRDGYFIPTSEARELFDLRERVQGGVVLTREEAKLILDRISVEYGDKIHAPVSVVLMQNILESKLSTKEPAGE